MNIIDNDNYASKEIRVCSAIDKFIQITGHDLNDSQISELKNELRDIFFEYLNQENVQICDIDSLDNIAKVAFYRLVKVSKCYFYEKNTNSSYEYIESLRIKANNCKKDYESIMFSS